MNALIYSFYILIIILLNTNLLLCSINNISLEKVSFQNQQGITVPAYISTPKTLTTTKASYPAVVILHGCSGVFSYSDPTKGIANIYKEWSTKLTDLDYIVILVDSFSARAAEQNQCNNGSDGTSEVSERPYDVLAAFDYITTNSKLEGMINPNKVGLMGWSHGGSTTLSSLSTVNYKGEANKKIFQVGISFYPGCGLYSNFGGISTSTWVPNTLLFIFHGSIDPLYTRGYCDTRIKNALAIDSTITLEMNVYDGAQHSFDDAREVTSKFNDKDVKAKDLADAVVLYKFNLYLKGPVVFAGESTSTPTTTTTTTTNSNSSSSSSESRFQMYTILGYVCVVFSLMILV